MPASLSKAVSSGHIYAWRLAYSAAMPGLSFLRKAILFIGVEAFVLKLTTETHGCVLFYPEPGFDFAQPPDADACLGM